MAAPIEPDLRARVEDLLGALAAAIDDGEFERWPDFFTDDGFYQIIPRESWEAGHPLGIMTCAGRGMLRDRVAALRGANIYEAHTYCHVLSRPLLERTAEGEIAARSNFALYRTIEGRGTELFAAGKYLDRILDSGGELRLRSRHAVLESRRVDILIVLPV